MSHINYTGPENEGPKTGRKLGLCKRTAEEVSQSGELGIGLGKRRHSGGGTGGGKRKKYNQGQIINKKNEK